ncbi:unnamed protein product [Mesocestoides corti]|uniref:TOG domain-containing protein n=1 Tax=Mesocestoides corti TaxID=53468 RepID=A0A158QSW6_MESCO|nr:unnamed protein product [Mesocestoides corti]
MNTSPPSAGVAGSGSDSQLQPQNTTPGPQEQDEYYPLAVLVEELRNEDVRLRLNSIQKLSTIALALGYEKTRTQLIPFITDSIFDVEDVMVVIAEKLGSFVPYVGGIAYAPCLINPLESLALVEDASVREKAVQSLRHLAREHSDKDLQEQIFPLVRRLATGDWYSSRASACGLFAVVYGRLDSSSRQVILSLAQTLASDDAPMVRRALAAVLGELALAMVGVAPESDAAAAPSLVDNAGGGSMSADQEVGGECMPERLANPQNEGDSVSSIEAVDSPALTPIEETPEVAEARGQIVASLMPLYNVLAYEDEQESVRIAALEATVPIARALGPVLAEQQIIPGLQKVADFKSWRSRCLLARKLTLLQTVLGSRITKNYLIDIFLSLLADDIVEVRSATACQITSFTSGLLNGQPISSGPEKMDVVTTSANEGSEGEVEDPSTPKALGDAEAFIVQRLLPAISDLNSDSNVHVKSKLGLAVLGLAPLLGRELTVTHLLPIILAQLKDESPDTVNNVIGVDHVSSSLLPAIVELAKVPVWRIRLAVINQMPLIADQLGQSFFEEGLMQHFLGWLADAAYAVREAAVVNLTRLTEKFGPTWARTFFLSEITQLSHNENYLQRMISLQCIMSLSPIIDAETCSELLLPTALKMDHDRVPNVRFKVAQALAKVGSVVGPKEVMPCLLHLLEDPDTDVRFYAAESIDFLKRGGQEESSSATKMDTEGDTIPATA